MSERINPRPEVRATLHEFTRLVELFEETHNYPQLQGLIAVAIIGTLNNINLEEEELFLVTPTLQDRITDGITGYYLCSASEERLLRSLEDTGVVLVNGFLLAKMIGKISVLALETKEGFMAGHWYAPRSKWMRDAIRGAFDEGENKITLDDDVWDYMRQAEVNNLTGFPRFESVNSERALLDLCKITVLGYPSQLPKNINGLSRQEYREKHREKHREGK